MPSESAQTSTPRSLLPIIGVVLATVIAHRLARALLGMDYRLLGDAFDLTRLAADLSVFAVLFAAFLWIARRMRRAS